MPYCSIVTYKATLQYSVQINARESHKMLQEHFVHASEMDTLLVKVEAIYVCWGVGPYHTVR